MNIYLITQDDNSGYDTFDSAVVIAPDEETARHTHPYGYTWKESGWYDGREIEKYNYTWITPDKVEVNFLGVAMRDLKPGIILASFNAG